jgi:CubicO group peptidase (beta-lactamase class C family)
MTRPLIKAAFAAVLALATPLPALAQAPAAQAAPDERVSAMRADILAALQALEVPGAAVAVVKDDQVLLVDGFGVRELGKPEPVTADTQFVMASTTKAFATFGLGLLADEGKLDFDTPVRTYIPEFTLADPIVGAQVTPRDMVTHRTGLPRHDLVWYDNNTISRQDVIARLRYLELSAPLREKYQYNNLMFISAGRLLERVSGQSWEDFTRARIFAPLGMTRSNFSVRDMAADANHASPHQRRDGKTATSDFRNADMLGPAGSMNSTARDLSQWLRVQLNGGMLGDTRIIGAETLAQMHRPQMSEGVSSSNPDIGDPAYGMGWRVDTYRGLKRVHHAGALDGFRASVMLFPQKRVGVVTLVNVGPSEAANLINLTLADRLLELPPRPWAADAAKRRSTSEALDVEAKKRLQELKKRNAPPSHPLADYVGAYDHPAYGRLTIKQEKGRLWAHINTYRAPLEHWHYDIFRSLNDGLDDTLENDRFSFETDIHGRIASFTVGIEPRVAPIRFKRAPDESWFTDKLRADAAGTYLLNRSRWVVTEAGGKLFAQAPGAAPALLELDIEPGVFVLSSNRAVRVRFQNGGMDLLQLDGIYSLKRAG